MYEGEEKIEYQSRAGIKAVSYKVYYKDGKEIKREKVATSQLQEDSGGLRGVGTKKNLKHRHLKSRRMINPRTISPRMTSPKQEDPKPKDPEPGGSRSRKIQNLKIPVLRINQYN